MAYVQLKDGCSATEEEITSLVKAAKGAVAAPKRVAFVPSLPLTALSKVDKKALRSQHWAAGDRAVH
jgi:fatty-acyl-CoA synthase